MSFFDIFSGRREHRFEQQIRPHLDSLYRYAYRLTGNQHDAEDLVQDLLIHLFDKRIDLNKLENTHTWLLKSLYHKFIDFIRKQQRNPGLPNDVTPEYLLDQIPEQQNQINTIIEQQHSKQQLELALLALNPDQKMVIVLHDIEGYKLNELSRILDTPVGTLKSRLHRARAELKKSVNREPLASAQRVTG